MHTDYRWIIIQMYFYFVSILYRTEGEYMVSTKRQTERMNVQQWYKCYKAKGAS